MKIFQNVPGFENKVNFVDEENVVLGYDLTQNCCEAAGWFIHEQPLLGKCICDVSSKEQPTELPGFVFDKDYYLYCEDPRLGLDRGGLAIFRATNSEGQELFIHLYNCHNGFYTHGFCFSTDNEETILRDDSL